MKIDFIYLLDLLGVFACAISGTVAASRKRMDFFGGLLLAAVTAIGGGTLRDLILGAHPLPWVTDLTYLMVITFGFAVTVVFKYQILRYKKTLFLFDAIGLGVFTIIGVEKALRYEVSPAIALIMGTFTGVMGGVIRDTLCSEVPLIFRKEIYATASIAGGLLYLLLEGLQLPPDVVAPVAIFFIIAVRTVSYYFNLQLPQLPHDEPRDIS